MPSGGSRKCAALAWWASSRPSKPGENFQYTSGCPLATPSGFMVGSYQMQNQRRGISMLRFRPSPSTAACPRQMH